MNTISNVDSAMHQSINNMGVLAGNAGTAEDEAAGDIQDIVTLASKVGPRRIANIYDTVRFSELVPKPIAAKTLEDADYLAAKIDGNKIVSAKEEKKIREDKVFAALVGMRLMQQSDGEVKKAWIGGLQKPTDEEIQAAYRRLTQRVSNPDESEDAGYVHKMRIELLDYYREYPQMDNNVELENDDSVENLAA